MIGKNNKYLKDTRNGVKVESYSIKKFKVGAASVVSRDLFRYLRIVD